MLEDFVSKLTVYRSDNWVIISKFEKGGRNNIIDIIDKEQKTVKDQAQKEPWGTPDVTEHQSPNTNQTQNPWRQPVVYAWKENFGSNTELAL